MQELRALAASRKLLNLVQHQEPILKSHILDVFNGMDAHIESEEVQTKACYALAEASLRVPAARAHIYENMGVRCITSVMNLHETSEPIQRLGCKILKRMSDIPENVAGMVEQGCVPFLKFAKTMHGQLGGYPEQALLNCGAK